MNGHHILDAALIISLLVQATKLSDFVFSESQRQSFQDKMELFTIHLQGINPQKYFFTLLNDKISRQLILGISFLSILFIIAILFYDEIKYGQIYYMQLSSAIFLLSITVIGGWVALRLYGFRLLQWAASGNFIIFYLRWNTVLLLWLLPLCIFLSIRGGSKSFMYVDFFFLIFCVSGWAAIGCIVSFYGFMVSTFQACIFLLSVFLQTGKWLFERIVEYNKGSIAAITLLLTVILGVIDIWMRSKK